MEQTIDTEAPRAQNLQEAVELLNTVSQQDSGEGQPADTPNQAEGLDPQPQADGGTETTATGEDTGEGSQKLTAKTLAEKLGIDAADLYAQFEVLEGMTLGELKDRAKDVRQSESLLASVTEQKMQIESELMRKRADVQAYMQEVGYTPSQERQEALHKEAERYLAQCDALASEYIGAWSDPEVKKAELRLIDELKDAYPFSEAVKPLMVDPALVAMMRDHALLRRQVSDMAKRYKKPSRKQKPQGHTQVGGGVDKLKSQVATGQVNQNDAVAALGRLLTE